MNIEIMIDEIEKRGRHIPFGNSAFQIRHFTQGGSDPGRRGRYLTLYAKEKVIAPLKECQRRRRRLEIDLEEKTEIMKSLDPGSYEARRLEIDIEEINDGLNREVKYIEDAVYELIAIYEELKDIPPIESREQFEAGESRYWIDRLVNDAVRDMRASGRISGGTLESLSQIGIQDVTIENGTVRVVGHGAAALLQVHDKEP